MSLTDDEVVAVAAHRHGGMLWDSTHLLLPVCRSDGARVQDRHLVVPLPSSPELKVWLYAPPEDAEDYLDQLGTFIQEELDTGAFQWAKTVEERGFVLFLIAPYGFERSDLTEHARLLALVGEGGWHQDGAGRFLSR